MRVTHLPVLVSVALLGCDKTLEPGVDAELSARVAALEADAEQAESDRLALEAELRADLLSLTERLDAFDPSETGTLAEDLDALAVRFTAHEDDTALAMTSLQSADSAIDGRLTTLETTSATQSALDALSTDVAANYATTGSLADVVRVSELGPEYTDVSDLVDDLTNARADIAVIEADYATMSTVSAIATDVSAIEAAYATTGSVSAVAADVSAIEDDYATSTAVVDLTADVSTLTGRVADVESDYLDSTDYDDLAGQIAGKSGLTLIAEPQLMQFACNSTGLASTRTDVDTPDAVPNDATGLLVNLYTFSVSNDHVNHHFGRSVIQGSTFDNEPYIRDVPMSDVSITHIGGPGGWFANGFGHGTSVIPLKDNGTFDVSMCRGWSSGDHFITVQVNGYYR